MSEQFYDNNENKNGEYHFTGDQLNNHPRVARHRIPHHRVNLRRVQHPGTEQHKIPHPRTERSRI